MVIDFSSLQIFEKKKKGKKNTSWKMDFRGHFVLFLATSNIVVGKTTNGHMTSKTRTTTSFAFTNELQSLYQRPPQEAEALLAMTDYWIVPNDQGSGINLETCARLRIHRQFYKIRPDEKFFGSTAASLTQAQKQVNLVSFSS